MATGCLGKPVPAQLPASCHAVWERINGRLSVPTGGQRNSWLSGMLIICASSMCPVLVPSCGMLLPMKCCWGVAWRADMCSFLGACSGLHFHRWQHAAWPASRRHRGDGARRQQQLSQRQCQRQCVLLGRRFRIGQCQCHCNQQQRLILSPDCHKLCRVACAGLMSLLH